MISHFLVGLVLPPVAIGLALPKSDHALGTGAAFNIAPAGVTCQCCWRDCEEDAITNESMVMASSVGAATEVLAIDAKVDAWLLVTLRANNPGFSNLEWNRYTPILETVKAGVESRGSVARIVEFEQVDEVIQSVKSAATHGKRPLVFSVAQELSADPQYTVSKLAEAKAAGSYLVVYQTEPAGPSLDNLGYPKLLVRTSNLATSMGADEVWDYTRAHADNYPSHVGALKVRFVPPGYVSKLDVGVDVSKADAETATVGYMGSGKATGMGNKYRQLLGSRMFETNSVWSNEVLKWYLEKYPIQLNQHRWQTCCPRDKWEDKYQHLESFRMATLLANKACVISAPSAIPDMQTWKSMVTFVEVEDTALAMDKLARNLTDCRIRSYETYKREFAPQKLLLKAGFFESWRPPHGI